jgi:hypothetical protein
MRIEAVVGVLAERAYEKAREGGLEEAVKTSKSIAKAHKGCY